ncbi:MAG: AI-2E family transporter [Neisseriaceae bacterium]|nr:AI-2E family transporter [Neisseriaceae bacterium]
MYYPQKKQSIWTILGILALIVIAVWLFVALKSVLTPFVTAAVLAYILNPLTHKLAQKMSRGKAAMLVMLFAFAIIIVLMMIVIPMLINQTQNLIAKIPQLFQWANNTAVPFINRIFHTQYSLDAGTFNQLWGEHNQAVQAALKKLAPSLLKQGGGIMAFVVNLMLLPFLLYYFLLDWQRWIDNIYTLIPLKFKPTVKRIAGNLDEVLGEFLRGQLSVMLIMGVVYGTGLMLTGLDNGFAIGMIAGLLVFVPYLGAFTGLLLATFAALLQFHSIGGLLAVWAVFMVGQFLESFIITPKIVGEKIGLSPLAVIFALTAFGELLGFVGMLLALPLAAMCVVLFREAVAKYHASDWYLNKE